MIRPVRIFLLLTLPLLNAVLASGVESPRIRVLCQTEWSDAMLDKPPPESGRTYDVTIALSAIPPETTARELLAIADKHTGYHAGHDFTNHFRLYRQDENAHAYRKIDHRRLRDPLPIGATLRDGDIVVFHGIVDRFGLPDQKPKTRN
jgi:hypothetical protein